MSTDTFPEGLQASESTESGNRRRVTRIDEAFQNRFRVRLLGFAFLILVFASALSLIIPYFITHVELISVSLWVPFGVAAVGGSILIFKLCDRISLRYCGPTIPILRTLEAVRRGERPAPIQLRKRDEFHQLAAALNATLQSLGAMDPPAAGPDTNPGIDD